MKVADAVFPRKESCKTRGVELTTLAVVPAISMIVFTPHYMTLTPPASVYLIYSIHAPINTAATKRPCGQNRLKWIAQTIFGNLSLQPH